MHLTDYEYDYDEVPSNQDYRLHMTEHDKIELMLECEKVYERNQGAHQGKFQSVGDWAVYELAFRFWDDDFHVVVYDVGQAYGGPEEGGWNFTVYSVHETHKVEHLDTKAETLAAAEALRDTLREQYKDESYGTFGTSRFQDYWITVETCPQGAKVEGRETTTHRPHYC